MAESILHTLVDDKTMTSERALDVARPAEEIRVEVAALLGESEARIHEWLELLKRIGISLETDIGRHSAFD